MYTIRQILGATLGLNVSGVRHELAGIQKSYDQNQDGTIEKSEVLSAGKTAEQIKTHITELQKIADDSSADSGDRMKAIQIRTSLEAGLNEITKTTQAATQEARKDVGESIVVGAEAQSKALLSLLGITDNLASQKIIKDLKDTNIQSLMTIAANYLTNNAKVKEFISEKGRKAEMLIRELGYTPNGSIAFGGEVEKVQKFLELVSQANDKTVYSKVATYAQAGLAMTVAEKDKGLADKLSDINSVVNYLSDVPTARYRKSDVQTVLTNLAKKPEDFVKSMNRVLGTNYANLNAVVTGLKANPELKAQFFNAINTNGAGGVVGLDSFLRGKGADKARESVEKIDAMIKGKVSQARQVMEAQIAVEQDSTKKAQLQKALDEFNAKGESVITGEIRKVAEGAFVNIGRNANAIGAGVTYEAFVKGLTVSLGGGVYDGKVAPGIVLHYNVAAGGKVGETQGRIVEGNLGVGTSVFPAFLPFVTAGVRGVEKVTSFGMDGRGLIDSVGLQTQLSKGGAVSLVFANERMNEMEQGRQKLADMVGKIANKKSNEIDSPSLIGIIKDMKLSVRDGEVDTWVSKIQNVIRQNPGYDNLTPAARAVILMGLVNAEAEKAAIQEANNDKDARSFKGWSVGVGHILGVTFPIAGIMFKEGKVAYSHPKTEPTSAPTTTPAVAPAKAPESLNFNRDGYTISEGGKSITFKGDFVPRNVSIDAKIGSYDPDKKSISLSNGIIANEVVMTPVLSDDRKSLESLTVQLKSESTEGKAESVRGIAGLDQRLQTAIYAMNRNPEYKSFNQAIIHISNQEYDKALSLLEAFAKQKGNGASLTKEILSKLGDVKSNPSLLSQLLTYTYGADKVKNKAGTVDKTSYAHARKDTIGAEKRLGTARWNEDNETIFKNTETHTSKQLSDLISGQALSTSVFATPSRGTPRIDKYTGSIAVSDKISMNVSEAQKNALIAEHSKVIDSQFQSLKDFVKKAGKGSNPITLDQYKTILQTGNIPDSWKSLGIDFGKKPVFFEARAMASGNVCMNKTEGIGYPTFTITRAGSDVAIPQDAPIVTQVDGSIFNPTGGNMTTGEIVSGVGAGLFGEKPKESEPTLASGGSQSSVTGGEREAVTPGNNVPTGQVTDASVTPIVLPKPEQPPVGTSPASADS